MDLAQLYESLSALDPAALTFWQDSFLKFYRAWFYNDRWMQYFQGLATTVQVTVIALCLGVVLGVLVAVVRTAHDQQRPGTRNPLLGLVNLVAKVYVTVIRGTPMMVQLMIMGMVIFKSSRNSTMVGALALGINSGAYVAEVIRSGILAIDPGQTEAGRSLGFSKTQTMQLIVLPQAFKNILPAIGNEMIALLKETSVAGYVAVVEITKAGNQIKNTTYDQINPILLVALVYLAIVMLLTKLLSIMERRLRKNER